MQEGERIKVLCINNDSNPYGGVPVFLMNVFRHMDHELFQLDFLTAGESSYYPYKQEIKQAGGKAYAFHINVDSTLGKLKFGKQLYAFLRDHSYDIVHINSGAIFFDCISAIIVKSNGVKVIVHSHNTGKRSWWKIPFITLMKLIMQKNADVLCACSYDAALYTFTKRVVKLGKVIIIKNGIDLQKFQYNEKTRNKIREELHLGNRFVVGHVGRFAEQKNHEFLIDIFAEIIRKEPTAMLLLIGKGELEDHIKEKVYNLKLQDNVIFLGQRSDTETLYQAMDVFLLPSLYEGLGIVLVEAQASGLTCVISDTVAKEADLTQLIHHITLDASAEEWAQFVLSVSYKHDNRCSYNKELMNAGYDINQTALEITEIYEELAEKKY